jgi:hypothetical protein
MPQFGADDVYRRRLLTAVSTRRRTDLPGGYIRRLVATYIGVRRRTLTCVLARIKLS